MREDEAVRIAVLEELALFVVVINHFLGLQLALWITVWRAGLLPTAGPYPSVFWALTTFHALHVLVGLGALGALAWRTARGIYNAARHLPVRLWTMYWHFVGAVWLLIFASVFVF